MATMDARKRPRRLTLVALVLAVCLVALDQGVAAEPIRIGVLKFGTVNWELDVIKAHGLDRKEGVSLEVLGLAGKNATSVAFQAGEVDIIVTDWIWVSRQRAEGLGYSFVPFSTAAGAVMAPSDSPVHTLGDLKGRSLGIAGGPLDKSWLLLRALAGRNLGFDADREIDKTFAAPPLVNEQILAGRLDAVLNFWHYAARLEAAGFRRVMDVDAMIRALGIDEKIPLIGYIFDETWAAANRDQLLGFLAATRGARDILRESDEEWVRLRPLMKAKDDATFRALRDNYRRGIPERWGEQERAAARRLFAILAEQGGKKLVGRSEVLEDGTFWPDLVY